MVAHNVPACWMVLLMCVLCCRWAACHSCHSMSCSVMLVWHFICTWIDAMCTRTDMFHRSHPLVTTWVCRRILIHGLCLFEGLSVLGTSPYLYHPCKSLPTYLAMPPLLVGHPRDGGFGVLPWRRHILARHAVWAVKLMQGHDQVAWVHLARLLLAPADSVCPAWATFAIAMCADARHGPTGRILPAPLARLVTGFKSLPQWRDMSVGQAVVLGDWCANAPLWCNPLLVQQSTAALPIRGLEADFVDLAELSTLTTVRHALAALADISHVHGAAQYMDTVFPFWFKRSSNFLDKDFALQRITALVAAIPQTWRDAAAAAPANGSAVSGVQVVHSAFERIGWYDPVHPGQPVKLAGLTVKQATSLQMQPIATARQVKQDAFLAEAHDQGVQVQHGVLFNMRRCLHALFHQLWQLKWDNARKELFWRLVLDGLPTSARMHMLGQTCACGILAPGRLHHYWECPVAQAVVHTIDTQLPQHHHVRRINVWLAKVPAG